MLTLELIEAMVDSVDSDMFFRLPHRSPSCPFETVPRVSHTNPSSDWWFVTCHLKQMELSNFIEFAQMLDGKQTLS